MNKKDHTIAFRRGRWAGREKTKVQNSDRAVGASRWTCKSESRPGQSDARKGQPRACVQFLAPRLRCPRRVLELKRHERLNVAAGGLPKRRDFSSVCNT
jgi:hypothetical protein